MNREKNDGRELNSAKRELLRDLYSQPDGMDIYKFHEKYRLTPGQLLTLIELYEKQNIVELQEYRILLTESGRQWVLANRVALFLHCREKTWKEIPAIFQGDRIESGETYLPRRKNLNLKFFEKLSK